jgi:putative membrane protein
MVMDERTLSRSHLVMLGVVLFFYAVMTVLVAISWARHDAGLQMQVAGLGLSVMYVVCVWHCTVVKGGRQAVVFFAFAAVITFSAEYVGNNFGWIFGEYHYTGSLGPRIGGVPVLIVVVWGVVLYSSLRLVTWISGASARERPRNWPRRVGWSAMLAAATGFVAASWDLMADPMAVSGVWKSLLGLEPWWWWQGGTYLPELRVWQGAGGIPVSNFVGWFGVVFVIVFVFTLLLERPDRATNRALDAVPWLIYAYLYYTMVAAILEMNTYDPGIHQAVLIGSFTMGPVILLGLIRLVGADEVDGGGDVVP